MQNKKYNNLHLYKFFFCKIENIRTHFPPCNNKHFLKVKQVSFEFIMCYSMIDKIIKTSIVDKNSKLQELKK